MIQIGRAIVSFDVFEKHFLCDITKCKGICCVEGDSGAPLTQEEAQIIEEIYPTIEADLPRINRKEVEKQGYSVVDEDGDLVTPLVNNGECVYTYRDEKGVIKCAIEKAWIEKKIDFQKPISCHLFPIRITEYEDFDALNYQQLDICKSARICGFDKQVRIYQMLKAPLIRKYGKEWYEELVIAADMVEQQGLAK